MNPSFGTPNPPEQEMDPDAIAPAAVSQPGMAIAGGNSMTETLEMADQLGDPSHRLDPSAAADPPVGIVAMDGTPNPSEQDIMDPY
jgi:hypothetical protein